MGNNMTFYNTGVDQILVDSGSRNFFPDIISFVIITSELNIDIESTVDYGNMGCEVSKGGQSAKILL